MSDSNLPFRVPVQLTVGDQDAVQVFASFFAGFPAFNTTSLCILQSNVGASSAGLYVEENNRWKFACPFDDVCDMVVSGGSLSVYQDLVSEVAAPDNAIVYKNGVAVSATELEPGTTLWAAIVVTQSGSGSGGSGTVTSVGLTLPSVFVVSGSPVTQAGNLSATLATQAPARIFAGPATGANAAPTFRALAATDLPLATTALAGAVKAGTNVNIAGDGTISVAAVPAASSTLPAADGTAAIGTSVTFARADHVHPIATTIGTVKSVGLTLPDIFAVAGSPVTTTGTLAATLATQAPALVFASPATGANAAPTFRALAATDLPLATTTTAGAVTAGSNVNIAAGVISVAAVPLASSTLPTSDGTAAIGTGTTFARADHVHPIAATIGTVKSVSLTMPSIFAVAGSPVTTTGTLAATLATQAPALVFAGPATGANAAPTFRALAATDLPIATAGAAGVVKIGSGVNVAGDGTISVTAGGTGTVTSVGIAANTLFGAATPITTAGNLTQALASQAANTVLIAPNGVAGAPTMRKLAPSDLPIATSAALGVASFGTGLTVTAGGAVSVIAVPAVPTAVVGTAAIAGTATTYMRSDASPALNLAVAPTWTGLHTFSAGIAATTITTSAPAKLSAGFTFATLPPASTALDGARAFITDGENGGTFGSPASGGGTTRLPVFCDGNATTPQWIYG